MQFIARWLAEVKGMVMAEKKLDGNYFDRPLGGKVPLPGNGGGVKIVDKNVSGVPGSVPGTASGPAKDAPIQPTPRDR
jgi:hypothetical protein